MKINIVKKTRQNRSIKISQDKYFYLIDGGVLKDLEELVEALEKMTKETFDYHVTEEKNDFANWIENVFENKKLATEIKKIKSAKITAQKIKAKIK